MKKVKFKVLDRENGEWMLENVRVSYPNLWKVGKYKGRDKERLDTSFLTPIKQKEVIKLIIKEMVVLAKTVKPKIKKMSEIIDIKFLKSADGEHYVLNTSNTLDWPPIYFNLKGKVEDNPLANGADKQLYAGCYAKIKVKVNPQIIDSDVKLWVNLTAIQFADDGEKLGNSQSIENLSEGFDEVEGDFDKPNSKASDDDFEDDDFEDDDFEDDDFEDS